MPTKPSLDEIRVTVTRMERRLTEAAAGSPEWLTGYDRLVPRSQLDLRDDRDFLLARSAALMLIAERMIDTT